MMDRKALLSTLWIFAVLNYIYADIFSLYKPGVIGELMTGMIGGVAFTPIFLLVMSAMMETAIVMVLFSRILGYRWNRILNVVFGVVHTLAVLSSLFVGESGLYYIMFSGIEIITTISIVIIAWKWKK